MLISPTLPSNPLQSYVPAPNYSKESTPPVAIWKGHSFNTISAREAEKFSGKDSGKGDSDFNDSDSDISGDALKKDLITHMQNGKGSVHFTAQTGCNENKNWPRNKRIYLSIYLRYIELTGPVL